MERKIVHHYPPKFETISDQIAYFEKYLVELYNSRKDIPEHASSQALTRIHLEITKVNRYITHLKIQKHEQANTLVLVGDKMMIVDETIGDILRIA